MRLTMAGANEDFVAFTTRGSNSTETVNFDRTGNTRRGTLNGVLDVFLLVCDNTRWMFRGGLVPACEAPSDSVARVGAWALEGDDPCLVHARLCEKQATIDVMAESENGQIY